MARRWEWAEQVRLAGLLAKWCDPDDTFATAIDSVSGSAMAGYVRKRRGVVPGLPDNSLLSG
jgi:hypothetical protein